MPFLTRSLVRTSRAEEKAGGAAGRGPSTQHSQVSHDAALVAEEAAVPKPDEENQIRSARLRFRPGGRGARLQGGVTELRGPALPIQLPPRHSHIRLVPLVQRPHLLQHLPQLLRLQHRRSPVRTGRPRLAPHPAPTALTRKGGSRPPAALCSSRTSPTARSPAMLPCRARGKLGLPAANGSRGAGPGGRPRLPGTGLRGGKGRVFDAGSGIAREGAVKRGN